MKEPLSIWLLIMTIKTQKSQLKLYKYEMQHMEEETATISNLGTLLGNSKKDATTTTM